MRLLLLLKRKSGVSPVIATVLLIAVSLAAGAVVSVILSNIEENTPTIDTNAALGITSTSGSQAASVDTEITELSGDISLMIQNISDYTSITIKLTYSGNDPFIYVIDFDILIYGEKLDVISPWTIVSATGASYTTDQGQYAGYAQATGTTVNYVVEVEDITNPRARIPDATTFSYEVKYGEAPGLISNLLQTERQAKITFAYVEYNVSIFHWNSNFKIDSAANQLEQTLISNNGTNNLFFKYDRNVDAFDISDPNVLSYMNITAMTEKYQVIMVDKWLVPTGAGTQILELHNNGISMMFYGTIEEFDPKNEDFDVVISNIDYTTTENVTGLVPNVYQGDKPKGTVNGYRFFSSSDGVLSGLSGDTFNEIPRKSKKVKGDQRGFDVAQLTLDTAKFDVLGNASYKFYDEDKAGKQIPKNLIWENNGPLLIRKNKIIDVSGDVYSFVWKTHEDIKDKKATKTSGNHLSTMKKNMLLALVGELERQAFVYGELSIDSLDLIVKDNKNKKFDLQISASVKTADIDGGALVITIDMPDNYKWKKTGYKYNMYINGNRVLKKIKVDVNTTSKVNTLVLDIGSVYSSNIAKNSVILINISEKAGDKKWMELKNEDTTVYTWLITADYESGIFALPSTATYSVDTAVDQQLWP